MLSNKVFGYKYEGSRGCPVFWSGYLICCKLLFIVNLEITATAAALTDPGPPVSLPVPSLTNPVLYGRRGVIGKNKRHRLQRR